MCIIKFRGPGQLPLLSLPTRRACMYILFSNFPQNVVYLREKSCADGGIWSPYALCEYATDLFNFSAFWTCR